MVLEELSCAVKLFTKSARFFSESGTPFTVLVVYTPVSVAKRCSSDSVVLPSRIPRTNLASARTLSDSVTNFSTW